jgi:hypothetical protein
MVSQQDVRARKELMVKLLQHHRLPQPSAFIPRSQMVSLIVQSRYQLRKQENNHAATSTQKIS